jgi:hypothetical protein
LTLSLLDVRADSLLAQEQTTGSNEVRQLLGVFSSHALNLLELGVEYDTRDNETVTSHGQYHALSARYSPALAWWMPYDYVQSEGISQPAKSFETGFDPFCHIDG